MRLMSTIFMLVAVIALSAPAVAQQESKGAGDLMMSGKGSEMFPSGPVRVSLPENAKKTVSPVLFDHETHENMLCGHCHHAFFIGDTVKVRRTYFEMQIHGYDRTDIGLVVPHKGSYSCSQKGCHTSMKKKSGKGSFYAAFHAEEGGSCYNCHVEEIEAGGNQNCPTKCQDCHGTP